MTRLTISTATVLLPKASTVSTRRSSLLGGHRIMLSVDNTIEPTINSSTFSNRRVVGSFLSQTSSKTTQFWS